MSNDLEYKALDCNCGGTGQLICLDRSTVPLHEGYRVECRQCAVCGPEAETWYRATSKWNALIMNESSRLKRVAAEIRKKNAAIVGAIKVDITRSMVINLFRGALANHDIDGESFIAECFAGYCTKCGREYPCSCTRTGKP
jgi:hypothetical protein